MLRSLNLFILMMLTACQATSLPGDFPALVIDHTPESHAELVRVVSQALNGRSVTLAEDVLMNSSRLIIERKARRNLHGKMAGGRVLESPEQFRLVMNGARCELVHQRGDLDQRFELKEIRCRKQ